MDLEVILYLYITKLKEAKLKEYTILECEHNLCYVFKDVNEFYEYFYKHNVTDKDLINICKLHTTSKGKVLAIKSLCDYTITGVLKKNPELAITKEDKIHARGNLTNTEQAYVWETLGLCFYPPQEYDNSRCKEFKRCVDCLTDHTLPQEEYEPMNLGILKTHYQKLQLKDTSETKELKKGR